jgi:AcrR family transcriptional regulator
MLDVENRTQIKRVPRQERSQTRFEHVLEAAVRLFAARGYESVSMREIARESRMPIASVYQYFPTKLAIVREMWTRYTTTISGTLENAIRRSILEGRDPSNELIGFIVDRMAELQASNPAFIEIWSCVAASIELRALNVEDTLQNARLIADFLAKTHPQADPGALYDRALIAIEMSSATTRLALSLPEPHRSRILLSLKKAIALLVDAATLNPHLSPAGKIVRADGRRKVSSKARAITASRVAARRKRPAK